MPTARPRRTLLVSAAVASALSIGAATASSASSAKPAHGSADRQQQTCPIPVLGADADTVTLTGPAAMWPPKGQYAGFTLTAAETPGEKGDHLPHGITISYSVSVDDGNGAMAAQKSQANPPTGATNGDFSVPIHFQLRAQRGGNGVTRTYHIAWTATFDGGPHTCSSSDMGEHPFTVTVAHDRRR